VKEGESNKTLMIREKGPALRPCHTHERIGRAPYTAEGNAGMKLACQFVGTVEFKRMFKPFVQLPIPKSALDKFIAIHMPPALLHLCSSKEIIHRALGTPRACMTSVSDGP